MNEEELKNYLYIAKRAAKEAGLYLVNNADNTVLSSTDKDIKLQADISAEKIIKDILVNESNIPILAEESGLSSQSSSEIFWVVDPLDGTANYLRGLPLCCVSIALMQNYKPIAGVIYDFNSDSLYEGSAVTKAYMNGEEISVSRTTKSSEGVLMTGLPNDTDYSDETLLNMVKNFQNWRKVRMIGSAALASVYVASGKADLYMEKKSYLWDVAAGSIIVEAAGGQAVIKNQNKKFQVDVSFSNSVIKI